MDFAKSTQIMGVLNITPDSFYDGNAFFSKVAALEHAETLISEGATIIDIGGESTFVDRDEVSIKEELNRIIPVIKEIATTHKNILISVDTYKAEVAKRAIQAGAHIVNDVTAGRGDAHMLATVAQLNVPYIMMYAKDANSRTTTDTIEYNDVIQAISDFLKEKTDKALTAGISKDNIIIDPGLGFFVSGNADYSYEIIARLTELKELGYPIVLSPSRKSFLAGSEKVPAIDRLPATIAASTLAVMNGANIIRTHDVLEVRRGCEVATQLQTYGR